jgi:hypothetical protein
LKTQRHVAIHGDSKQGKSWLRGRLLDAADTVVVQCQVDSTPEAVFREALGVLGVRAEIKRTGVASYQGVLDFSAGGELGNLVIGKAKVDAKAGVSGGDERQLDTRPIGTTPADLSWVARTLKASERRLVIEDFHYVAEDNRKDFAFVLKALGDYGVNVIVVGIWPEDHLLTYYNGDLDGRVEDLRLLWSDEELDQVLVMGCAALNIELTDVLRAELVKDAYGNVGLVQRLAEQICLAASILEEQKQKTTIDVGSELSKARETVSDRMRARYDSFADDFVRGMKRMTRGLEVYKHMLRAFTSSKSDELLNGIDSKDLLSRIQEADPDATIRQSDLTQALDRIDRLQVKIGVHPQVLTYNRDRRRLFLADRSFLFYRQYGSPRWPWERDETLDAALATARVDDQLDLDAEFPLTQSALNDLPLGDDVSSDATLAAVDEPET